MTFQPKGDCSKMSNSTRIEKVYEAARQHYAELGVETDNAIETLSKIPISLHCWQGDDVGGFETAEGLTEIGRASCRERV